MGRPRKYSDGLRRRAIDEVLEPGRKINEVARDLAIGSPETLRNWVAQARRERGLEPGASSEEIAEIRRLRKEVADQQRTIEILKAATTFFVQAAWRRQNEPAVTAGTHEPAVHGTRGSSAAHYRERLTVVLGQGLLVRLFVGQLGSQHLLAFRRQLSQASILETACLPWPSVQSSTWIAAP